MTAHPHVVDSVDAMALLAALVSGDRWLSASACAAYLGMTTPKGEVNKRGFLERIACHPDFPAPLELGNQKSWKKSEVDDWANMQRRSA